MRAMRLPICLALLLVALIAPAAANAGTAAASASPPLLWATINSCDTAGPSVGIRASMPGNRKRSQRMYMRFSVQYRNAKRRYVETGSSSRWIKAGSGRKRAVQAGFDFAFAAPPAGSAFTLRGTVHFRWSARKTTGKGKRKRTRWRVVRTAKRTTRAGIKGVGGGVPKGASASRCTIAR